MRTTTSESADESAKGAAREPAAAKKSPRQLRREKEAAANREAWAPMQAELAARRVRMREMGGPERVRKYMHDRGKLDARQRIDALFDPGINQLIEYWYI